MLSGQSFKMTYYVQQSTNIIHDIAAGESFRNVVVVVIAVGVVNGAATVHLMLFGLYAKRCHSYTSSTHTEGCIKQRHIGTDLPPIGRRFNYFQLHHNSIGLLVLLQSVS